MKLQRLQLPHVTSHADTMCTQELDLAQQRIICEESVLVWRRIMGLSDADYTLQQHLDETFASYVQHEFPVRSPGTSRWPWSGEAVLDMHVQMYPCDTAQSAAALQRGAPGVSG